MAVQDHETSSSAKTVLFLVKCFELRKGICVSNFDEEALIEYWEDLHGCGVNRNIASSMDLAEWPFLDGTATAPTDEEKAAVASLSHSDVMEYIYAFFSIKKEVYPDVPFLRSSDLCGEASGGTFLTRSRRASSGLAFCSNSDLQIQREILEHFKANGIDLTSEDCHADTESLGIHFPDKAAWSLFLDGLSRKLRACCGTDICSGFLIYKRMSYIQRIKCCVFGFRDDFILGQLAASGHAKRGAIQQNLTHQAAGSKMSFCDLKTRRSIIEFVTSHAAMRQKLGHSVFTDFVLCHFLSLHLLSFAMCILDYHVREECITVDLEDASCDVRVQLVRPMVIESVKVRFGRHIVGSPVLVVDEAKGLACIGEPCNEAWLFEGFIACDAFRLLLPHEVDIKFLEVDAKVIVGSLSKEDLVKIVRAVPRPHNGPNRNKPSTGKPRRTADDEECIRLARLFLEKSELNNCKRILTHRYTWLRDKSPSPALDADLTREVIDLHKTVTLRLERRSRTRKENRVVHKELKTDTENRPRRSKNLRTGTVLSEIGAPTMVKAPSVRVVRRLQPNPLKNDIPTSPEFGKRKRMCFEWLEFGKCEKGTGCSHAHSLGER